MISMKPIIAVSGVFSSWLTLATKSRRICSASSVTERSITAIVAPRPRGEGSRATVMSAAMSRPSATIAAFSRATPSMGGSAEGSGAGAGWRSGSSTQSTAARTPGWRTTVTKGRFSRSPPPNRATAARLAPMVRALSSTASIGTGTPSSRSEARRWPSCITRPAASPRESAQHWRGIVRRTGEGWPARRRPAPARPCRARP